jgi:hypothetical protein
MSLEIMVQGADDKISKDMIIKTVLGRLDVKTLDLKISDIHMSEINEGNTQIVTFRVTGAPIAPALAATEAARAFEFGGMKYNVQAGNHRKTLLTCFYTTPTNRPPTEREDKVTSFRVQGLKKHKANDEELNVLTEEQFATIHNFAKKFKGNKPSNQSINVTQLLTVHHLYLVITYIWWARK